MKVTITNTSGQILSTGVAGFNPAETKIIDLTPEECYKAAFELQALSDKGYVTFTVAGDPLQADALEPAMVGTASVADGQVTEAKLAAGAVTSTKLGAGAVDATALGAGAVTTAKLGAGAVDAAALGAGSVVAAKLGAGAVTAAALGSGAVTFVKALCSVSAEQTGTGASQNVAHGLTGTPALVLAVSTDVTSGFVVTYGAHDGTNSVLTVTSGAKFKVLAWV
jgi:hypothetical protein